MDELAEGQEVAEEPKDRNPQLRSLDEKVDRFGDEDQNALVILLDSLVKRSQMAKVLTG